MRKFGLFICVALLGLTASAQSFDYSELDFQYAIGNYLLGNTICGTEVGQFSCDVKETLQEEVESASQVLENAASQSEITDAAQSLDKIINDYAESGIYDVAGSYNVSKLSAQISIVGWIISSTKSGNKPGQYPKDLYNGLYNARQDAKDVLKNATSQSQIDEQYNTLVTAVTTYKSARIPEEKAPEVIPLEKESLQEIVQVAENELQTTEFGTEIGQFPVAEYMSLSEKCQEGKDILASAESQSTIDSMTVVLQLAIQTYLDSEITSVDTDTDAIKVKALLAKIETATYLLENTEYGNLAGQYPYSEYRNLTTAKVAAQNAIETATTQNEIDEQETLLDEAISSYADSKNIEDVVDLEDRVEINVMANDSNLGETYGSGKYYKNASATLVAAPVPGYCFTGWNDGNTENPRKIKVTNDEVYVATFAKDTKEITDSTTYSILVVSMDENLGRALGSSKGFRKGAQMTITAVVAYDGYKFVRWNDGNTENPRQITVTEDRVFVAIFDKSTDVEEIAWEESISIVSGQILVDNEAPAFVYDVQGRKVANSNLETGLYFVVVNGKSFAIMIE